MTEETKSAEMKRKASKPIMEKKRRARINDSLQELKVLILEASKKDVSCHSKLEKADILEMTVQYLKNLKNNPITDNSKGDPLANYRAGFNECATEISRYLASTNGLGVDLKARLLEHLAVQYHAAVAAETAGSATQKPPLGVPCLPSMPRRAIPPSSPSLFSLLQQQQDSHIFGHSSQFQLLSAANLPDGKVAAILVPAASPLFMTTSVPPIHQELFPVLCKDPMVGSAPGGVPKVPLSLGPGSTFWRPF